MSNSEIHDYLTEIGRHPVLCKEAQLRHCQRIHAWIHHEGGRDAAPLRIRRAGQRSMEVMTRTNTRLVVSIAKRYQNRGLEFADLIQEGTLGLIRGLELFDPTRGYAVSTYIYWWIRQAITRALHSYARMIRLPINTHELIGRAQRFSTTFSTERGRTPTHTEIAEGVDVTPERLTEVLAHRATTACFSLDGLTGNDSESTLIDFVADPSAPEPYADIVTSSSHAAVEAAITTCLTKTETRILRGIFFENTTFRVIAEELGLSRARVGQIHQAALNKLRLHLASQGITI
jgi:RNA polymerase sigma factor (sigma-70 family)